jgi:hypothetical protein
MNEKAILARLDTLEAEVAALNAGLVKPAAQDVAPAKFVEGEVRITYPIERSPIAMPTEPELWRILRVVLSAYQLRRPDSDPRYEDEDMAGFFREFCAAFEGISHFRRTEEIDHKHTLSWWANEAMRRLGNTAPQDINSGAFLAAVIGAGDVQFTLTDSHGNVSAVGLARSGGRPATEAGWRRALAGQLLLPIAGRFRAPSGRPSIRVGAEQ